MGYVYIWWIICDNKLCESVNRISRDIDVFTRWYSFADSLIIARFVSFGKFHRQLMTLLFLKMKQKCSVIAFMRCVWKQFVSIDWHILCDMQSTHKDRTTYLHLKCMFNFAERFAGNATVTYTTIHIECLCTCGVCDNVSCWLLAVANHLHPHQLYMGVQYRKARARHHTRSIPYLFQFDFIFFFIAFHLPNNHTYTHMHMHMLDVCA